MLKYVNNTQLICIYQIIVVSLHRIWKRTYFTARNVTGNAGERPVRDKAVKNTSVQRREFSTSPNPLIFMALYYFTYHKLENNSQLKCHDHITNTIFSNAVKTAMDLSIATRRARSCWSGSSAILSRTDFATMTAALNWCAFTVHVKTLLLCVACQILGRPSPNTTN